MFVLCKACLSRLSATVFEEKIKINGVLAAHNLGRYERLCEHYALGSFPADLYILAADAASCTI